MQYSSCISERCILHVSVSIRWRIFDLPYYGALHMYIYNAFEGDYHLVGNNRPQIFPHALCDPVESPVEKKIFSSFRCADSLSTSRWRAESTSFSNWFFFVLLLLNARTAGRVIRVEIYFRERERESSATQNADSASFTCIVGRI